MRKHLYNYDETLARDMNQNLGSPSVFQYHPYVLYATLTVYLEKPLKSGDKT
ncbi:UNVERIFIED_CONTAM: hypothetical protein FKN15_072927 [Acipenser sinensis]